MKNGVFITKAFILSFVEIFYQTDS
jgi:hypothetical protein